MGRCTGLLLEGSHMCIHGKVYHIRQGLGYIATEAEKKVPQTIILNQKDKKVESANHGKNKVISIRWQISGMRYQVTENL